MPTSRGEVTAFVRDNSRRSQARLVLRDMSAGYGGVPIVAHVDLQVGLGEVVTIIGPNGAGKSTLVKAVIGEVGVLGGTIELSGADVTGLPAEQLARRGIGYVPQSKDVFDTLTVLENLEMGGFLLNRRQFQQRVALVYDRFPRLHERRNQMASKLSGGERKMLAIGRTLLMQPSLLVLDEPTAGLSPIISQLVLTDHVRELATDGTSVLLIEQKASEALAVSDWTYCLVDGQVRVSASAAEVAQRPDIGEILLGRKDDLDSVAP